MAHGAGIAGIRNGVLAFTPPDYEWDIPEATLADYRAWCEAELPRWLGYARSL